MHGAACGPCHEGTAGWQRLPPSGAPSPLGPAPAAGRQAHALGDGTGMITDQGLIGQGPAASPPRQPTKAATTLPGPTTPPHLQVKRVVHAVLAYPRAGGQALVHGVAVVPAMYRNQPASQLHYSSSHDGGRRSYTSSRAAPYCCTAGPVIPSWPLARRRHADHVCPACACACKPCRRRAALRLAALTHLRM